MFTLSFIVSLLCITVYCVFIISVLFSNSIAKGGQSPLCLVLHFDIMRYMPRGLREFEIGGIYHIINRGVEKRRIFLKNQDYSRFILCLEFFNRSDPIDIWNILAKGGSVPPLRLLGEHLDEERKKTKQQAKQPIIELMAFVLMPNHYHLVVREIIQGGISLFMRKMGGYATYFNKQYDRTGSLFQSRFKAVRIKDQNQLGTVFVYVHTNPVELKEPAWKDFKVKNYKNAITWLENYKWSSYHDYIGKPTFPTVTRRKFFLNFYGGEKDCRKVIGEWVKFKAENAKLGPEIIE